MTGTRAGLARSVQVRLARHAKAIGVDPNLVLTRYGVERFLYRLSLSRHAEQFDIGIGDAVTPGPQWLEYPSLLDLPRPRLRAYPRETVVAEKLHAMVLLGTRNSRMKDYFDVYALLREDKMDATELAHAIAATFERRRTPLPDGVPAGLSKSFVGDATKQAQWRAFLSKNRLSASSLDEIVTELRERLAEPLDDLRRRSAGA